MTYALNLQGLQKSFGAHRVLDGLDLSVPENSVFGFLGQNGAGKTTTMKLILGLLRADAGEIAVCGEKVRYGASARRGVGYLPDAPEFYGYMRPKEYLALCGQIAGMNRRDIAAKSAELLEMVGLAGCDKKIGGFSRGMKQRLGIAQALLGEPKLLLCDEPTSALDPVGRKEILDILAAIRGRTTVLFSTHILSDVERVCDRAAVLHGGKVALSGTLEEMRAKRRHDALSVEFSSRADLDAFLRAPAARGVEVSQLTAVVRAGDILQAEGALISFLAESGIRPVRLELQEPTLESLFMEAIQ